MNVGIEWSVDPNLDHMAFHAAGIMKGKKVKKTFTDDNILFSETPNNRLVIYFYLLI